MASHEDIRDSLHRSLRHIRNAYGRVRTNTGARHLTFPDACLISEGFLLSAWSRWEQFCQTLLIADLATDEDGALRREVDAFASNAAKARLAERLLSHPDSPDRFVEWATYSLVKTRANEFLGTGHRFQPIPEENDLQHIRTLRNVVAHRSDKAWSSFMDMIAAHPFDLAANVRRAITPGRFIYSHSWGPDNVLEAALRRIENASTRLVP